MRAVFTSWLAMAVLALGQPAAWAQATPPAGAQDEPPATQWSTEESGPVIDPPSRVARLSFLRGDVTFHAADAEAPEEPVINRPVTSGDRILTGADSRAELTMGIAAIRLDANTDFSVAILDDEIAELEVNSGTVSVHVRELPPGDTFQLNTPNSTIRLLDRGQYRVDVGADGSATLAVREGNAEIDSGRGPVRVGARQVARLARDAQYADIRAIGRMDAFDEWSADRERQMRGGESARYVSREVVGYEDLDRYGTWRSEPEYGMVWYPTTVFAGWAPYRYGTWTWISPWGWTWIDHAPWGFAPFHYGRWAFVRHRWCWVPGPRFRRPVYAPGLVVWTRWHDHGFHSGKFHHRHRHPKEWFPLGPREVYVPHHRASPRYLRSVNVSNTLIENNTLITHAARNRLRNFRFANRDVPGALSTATRFDMDRRTRWRTADAKPPTFAASHGRELDDRRLHHRRDFDRRDFDRRDFDRRDPDRRDHDRHDPKRADPTWRGPGYRDPTWQNNTWRGNSRNDRVGSPQWAVTSPKWAVTSPRWADDSLNKPKSNSPGRDTGMRHGGDRSHRNWSSHSSSKPSGSHARGHFRSDHSGSSATRSHQSRASSPARSQSSHGGFRRGGSSHSRR